LFDGTRVLPQADFWSPGWLVLPCDAKWDTWRLDIMVAWTILCTFKVRLYQLVRPVLLLSLQVFTSLPATVLHKKFIEGRYGRTSWFGHTTRDFSNKTNETFTRLLQIITFERLLPWNFSLSLSLPLSLFLR
jgi:hypothetical protein